MVEITVDEHPTSSTRTKRTRIIIIVSVFVLLLAGIAAIVGTFIYRYYERTKIASKSIDYEPTHTNNVLPTVDLNVVKDGNTLNDDGLKSHDDRFEDKDQPLIVNKPVVLDPPAEDKNGREDDSPVTKPVVKDPSDKNKKKNEEALREQELRNQEKLKKLEEDRIMEQNRIDSINRKFDEDDKKKKQDSKPKEDKDEDKKKDTEPKKVDENPNVVDPKEEGDVDDKKFKEDLDRLLKEKLDRCKELNKVLEDVKDRKKQENPGKTIPESTPKVVIVSGSDAIFKRLDGFAAKKGIAVVRGDFEDCIIGRCEPAEGEYVFEWELRLIAEIMDEAKKPFDLKYEFETIKKYRDFSKKFSRFYFTKSSFKLSYSNFRITRDKVEKHNKSKI